MTQNFKILGTFVRYNLRQFWFTPCHHLSCTVKIHEGGPKSKNLQIAKLEYKVLYLQGVN